MNEKSKTLRIIDAENNFEYHIEVTPEEYERAQTDMIFATKLLEKNREAESSINSGAPLGSQEINSAGDSGSDTTEGHHVWTEQSTKFFLCSYRDMYLSNTNIMKKTLWEKIALVMMSSGYKVSPKQCCTKMDSLKRTYKAIKDNNSKSGNSPKSWIYFKDMDDIFRKKAWANPLSTMASTSRSEDDLANEALTATETASCKKKARKEGLDELIKLKREEKDERRQQHKEKMQRVDRMNELLEKIISKTSEF